MRIGLSTGGGDAPGLNAVIRSAVLSAINRGWEVVGIRRGFYALLGEDDVIPLTREAVRGIGHMGGTILGTTNRGNPFRYPRKRADGTYQEVDRSDELVNRAKELGIDAIVTIGGDGSMALAQMLFEKGVKIVGVPKTIDNDVGGTLTTFGFDTAVNTAIEALDKLHTTAESHDRVIVMEVMGRNAGFIALHSGIAAGADVILIPEIPYDIDKVCGKITRRDKAGRHFSIVVVAEGAFPIGGDVSVLGESLPGQALRVGGIADRLAKEIQAATSKECRSLVLGHLQRGGMPTGYDRILATRFGGAAIRAVAEERWGEMVALRPPEIITVPFKDVLSDERRVSLKDDIVLTARAVGVSFGD
jgi:ATP-dependent phosphofructokinase / diphosphate-dependent phosphofructokinase